MNFLIVSLTHSFSMPPFCSPLKTPENLTVEKGCIGKKSCIGNFCMKHVADNQ